MANPTRPTAATTTTTTTRRRLRLAARIAAGVAVTTAVLAFVAPYIAVAHGTARMKACFAAYEAPRTAAHPECSNEIRWLITPSHLPWTRDAASYRGEELGARMAFANYRDAIIGMPDRKALNDASDALERSALVVEQGSRRLALDDLGPDIGAPNLGRSADLLGDRTTLLARFDRWADWHVRLNTLHAALIAGDIPLTLRIAKRYAEFDPRDEDLRVAVGALLCLGDDPKRGMDFLTSIQDDRASRRYAAMARNWGDVRALMVACGAKGGFLPPPKPDNPDAGQGLPMAGRALLRLRLMKSVAIDPIEEREREAAIAGAMRMLTESADPTQDVSYASAGSELRIPGTRAALLSAILASQHSLTNEQVITLASPDPTMVGGEPPLVLLPAITARDWMNDPIGGEPYVAPSTIERAAERAMSMADAADRAASSRADAKAPSRAGAATPPKAEAKSIEPAGTAVPSEAEPKALRAIGSALFIEAARAYSRAGDAAAAIHAIERGGPIALGNKAAIALCRSTARYVTLDLEGALAELESTPELSTKGAAASADQADPTAKRVLASALIQRAELLAALQKKSNNDNERAKAAAEAAIEADRIAAGAGDPALDARARWTRLAFAKASGAPALRPGTEVDIQPRLSAALAFRSPLAPQGDAARPAPYKGTGADRPFTWVDPNPPSAPWTSNPSPGGPALSTSLALWDAARSAPADERRALRYMVLRVRADIPPSPLAELSLAADLLGNQGDMEIWLDAFSALQSRSMSHRSFAWYRSLAAQWRGDEAAAARWKQAYEALVAVASDAPRAELARFMGI